MQTLLAGKRSLVRFGDWHGRRFPGARREKIQTAANQSNESEKNKVTRFHVKARVCGGNASFF
jgi:hypothetical protein